METPAGVEENDETCVEESTTSEKISSSPSSLKQITDPVIYKLVRVEGDGRLVPATDDEVMEVEDLLEDDKSELPLVADTGQTEQCISNKGLSSGKANLEGSEGLSEPENTNFDAKKLNARLEYIEVMLQKVKQEERLRLSCGSPDHSSDYMNIDGQCSDQHDKLRASDEKLHSENSLQEIVPSSSPRSNDNNTNQSESAEACLKPKEELANEGSSAPAIVTSLKPDFSSIKGEICLDNLSIKELHETFKATFGRETSVKDKLWLKRRIAMGLTNSCDVSTTTFIIKDKTLVQKKVKDESRKSADDSLAKDQMDRLVNDSCKGSPTSPSNQMEDRQLVAGKRLRKTKEEYDCKNEDLHTEQRAAKRVRRPTRRYIEELSEVESRECIGRLVSSVKNSGHGQFSPKPRIQPVCNVGSDGKAVVTRQDSFGGSGVQVPFVFRVRRGRPRKNFMPLMKYHPSGMGMAAKLVKKALGVRVSRQDESGTRFWNAMSAPKRVQQPSVAEAEKDEQQTAVTCMGEQQQQDVKLENIDVSGDNLENNIATVPTPKGGTRRKHHRAWTLCEVMKLVEGVSRYGAGRWSEIKRLAFASYNYRTSVDLKDKWRNLLRASFSQTPAADKELRNSRKHASMPVPANILLRVRELAEMHAQTTPDLRSTKFAGRSGRSVVHETMSGYL